MRKTKDHAGRLNEARTAAASQHGEYDERKAADFSTYMLGYLSAEADRNPEFAEVWDRAVAATVKFVKGDLS